MKTTFNGQVVLNSLIALFCLYLTFVHNWLWIIPAVFLSAWNYKLLFNR